MGVIDIKIDENETKIAASCFDSMIRIWDLEDVNKCIKINCNVFENWKVRFLDKYKKPNIYKLYNNYSR